MRFGIMFGNVGFGTGSRARAVAVAAERHGFESIWTVEHIVVPAGYTSPYPYAEDGRMPGPDEMVLPEPLAWLSFVAACTSDLKLGTGITVLPQRNPLVLAKEAATIDQLSGGRLLLGVGTGWLREEFAALGVPFEQRGARTDDYIRALRELWGADTASYQGRFVDLEEVYCRPRPVKGQVPIDVGGHSERAARRAGELGDGFYPGATDRETLTRAVEAMRRAATDAGRDPDAIEITTIGSTDRGQLDWLEGLGAARVLLEPPTFDPRAIDDGLAELAATLGIPPR